VRWRSALIASLVLRAASAFAAQPPVRLFHEGARVPTAAADAARRAAAKQLGPGHNATLVLQDDPHRNRSRFPVWRYEGVVQDAAGRSTKRLDISILGLDDQYQASVTTRPAQALRRDPAMGAFEELVERYAGKNILEGFRLVGIQHLLNSTASLVRALARTGVAPPQLFLIGKPYSQNRGVVTDLRHEGFDAHLAAQLSHPGRTAVQRNTTETDREMIIKTIERGLAGDGRFLILDDGGELIKLIHERFGDYADRFVAVEQTRKGIRLLEGLNLRFPVINVAECWAKLTYEAPMIGRAIGKAVSGKLDKLRQAGINPGRRATLVGYGVVGQALARDLMRRGFQVDMFDAETNPRRRAKLRAQARAAGVGILNSLDEAVAQGNILISATGSTTLRAEHIERLPNGAVLFNAASGNTEILPAPGMYHDPNLRAEAAPRPRKRDPGPFLPRNVELATRFRGCRLVIGNSSDGAHQDTILHTSNGKEILLANDGTVINFSGDTYSVPPRYIQLTRGLLYLGLLQAARARAPGVRRLARQPQRDLVAAVMADLGSRGETLEDPTF
jgi:S-adenosylhomocysteine hydrolase